MIATTPYQDIGKVIIGVLVVIGIPVLIVFFSAQMDGIKELFASGWFLVVLHYFPRNPTALLPPSPPPASGNGGVQAAV